jgi:hypothetical protein
MWDEPAPPATCGWRESGRQSRSLSTAGNPCLVVLPWCRRQTHGSRTPPWALRRCRRSEARCELRLPAGRPAGGGCRAGRRSSLAAAGTPIAAAPRLDVRRLDSRGRRSPLAGRSGYRRARRVEHACAPRGSPVWPKRAVRLGRRAGSVAAHDATRRQARHAAHSHGGGCGWQLARNVRRLRAGAVPTGGFRSAPSHPLPGPWKRRLPPTRRHLKPSLHYMLCVGGQRPHKLWTSCRGANDPQLARPRQGLLSTPDVVRNFQRKQCLAELCPLCRPPSTTTF